MRKHILTSTLLLLLALICANKSKADSFRAGMFSYATIPDEPSECVFMGLYDNTEFTGELRIPESTTDPMTNKSYKVTKVGNQALKNNSTVTAVKLSNSIKTIGESAFENCSALTRVTLSDSLITIGDRAFYGCSKLSGSLQFGPTLEAINPYAFYGCSGISSVTFNASLETIGNYAFSQLSKISRITIPGSVSSIGSFAFEGCTSLSSFSIEANDNDTKINLGSFLSSDVITKANITFYINRNWLDSYKNSAQYPFQAAKEVYFGEKVTKIPEAAFQNASKLTRVDIPGNVTEIERNAFKGAGLSTVILKDGIQTIGIGAFASTSINTVIIPPSVTSLGATAFLTTTLIKGAYPEGLNSPFANNDIVIAYPRDCIIENGIIYSSDKCTIYYADPFYQGHYTAPQNTLEICDNAFYHCQQLTSVALPDSLYYLGHHAFQKCTSLTSVNVPNITIFGTYAFAENPALKQVTLSSSLQQIGAYAFYGSGIRSIVIPSSVKTIESYAFAKSTSLSEITFNNGIEQINNDAFRDCSGLTQIVCPPSLHTIFSNAFNGCSLTSISLGHQISTLQNQSFGYVSAGTIVNIMQKNPPELYSSNPFGSNSATIRVLPQSVELYRNAPTWQNFNIQALATPDSVTINTPAINGNPGDQFTLRANIHPATTTFKNIYWSSSNPNVATVDNEGNVTLQQGAADNSCNIIAMSYYGEDYKAICKVNAGEAPSITANPDTLRLKVGESKQIEWIVNNAPNADYANGSYYSDDETIASISGNTVYGVNPGQTTVRYRLPLSDGSVIEGSASVIVEEDNAPYYLVSVNKNDGGSVFVNGIMTDDSITLNDESLTIKVVPYSGMCIESASYTIDGTTTYFDNTVTITGVSSSVFINVTFQSAITATLVEFAQKVISIKPGETITPEINFYPEGASNRYSLSVISGEDFVSADGTTITGLANGQAVIRVTTDNSLTDECTVNVSDGMTYIQDLNNEIYLYQPWQCNLIRNNAPVDGNIEWTSSNPEIIRFFDNGVMMVVKAVDNIFEQAPIIISARLASGETYSSEFYLSDNQTVNYQFVIDSPNNDDYNNDNIWAISQQAIHYITSGPFTGSVTFSDAANRSFAVPAEVTHNGFTYSVNDVTIKRYYGSGLNSDCELTLPESIENISIQTIIYNKLTSLATVPPTGSLNLAQAEYPDEFPQAPVVYVPKDAVDSYKSSAVWSKYLIRAIGDSGNEGGNESGDSGNASFDFTNPSSLSPAQSVSPNNSPVCDANGVTFTSNDIDLVTTGGSTGARLWATSSSVEYRIYNGATLTVKLTGNNKNITKITFNGARLNTIRYNGTTLEGADNSQATSVTWNATTDDVTTVSFNCVTNGSNKRADITSITVEYAGKESSIGSIATDGSDTEAEYYTLQGVRVYGTPVPGIYIKRHNGTVSKVLIK